jgi:protein LTV1
MNRGDDEPIPPGEEQFRHAFVPISKSRNKPILRENLPEITSEEGQFDDAEEESIISGIMSLSHNELRYDYERHYKAIGAPGAVFITASGKVIPSEEAAKMEVPEIVVKGKDSEDDAEIDPDLKDALENYDEGNYEELPDNFMEIAQLDIDEDGNGITFGNYGALDDIEDDEPKYKKPIPQKTHIQKPEDDELPDFEDDEIIEEETSVRKRSLVDEQFEIAMKNFNKDIEEMYESGGEDEEDEDEEEESEGQPEKKPKVKPPQAKPEGFSTSEYNNVFDQFLKEANKKEEIKAEKEKDTVALRYAYVADSDSEEFEDIVVKEKRAEWDCESILSTYSNLENHPVLIIEPEKKIKLNKRGFPNLPQESESESNEEEKDKQNMGVPRQKAETAEEKKQRKKQLKNDKKVKREQKKEMKLIYRNETTKQKTQHSSPLDKRTIIHYS